VLTQARLPAASLFKVVTTTALFESTSISPQDQVCINGGVHGIERRHLEPARGPARNAAASRGRWAQQERGFRAAGDAPAEPRRSAENRRTPRLQRKLPLDDGEQQAELGKLSVPYNDLDLRAPPPAFKAAACPRSAPPT
jgi:hypothetical protein